MTDQQRRKAMNVQPYLSFEGKTQEAIDFYKTAIGAQVKMMMRFKEAPPDVQKQMQMQSDVMDKVMHACVQIGDSDVFMSDGRCGGAPSFSGVTMTLNASSDAEAEKLFGALGRGGQVTMPMNETFFASRFGMVDDKFGVHWMVLKSKG
jgi:PhnB protein